MLGAAGCTSSQEIPAGDTQIREWRRVAPAAILAQLSLPVVILPSQTQGLVEVIVATLVAVVLCVVVHYEALTRLTGVLKRIHMPARPRILLLIFSILLTHVVEIWIFGGAYFYLVSTDGHGSLLANHPIGLFDAIYFSAVCFTTLGLGDLVPVGAVRFMTGTEALTGFVLIAWSASFTFVEMERFWKQ